MTSAGGAELSRSNPPAGKTTLNDQTTTAKPRRSIGLPSRVLDPALVAIFAGIVSIIGAGNPSFWYDEAATISGSTRSMPELARLLITSEAAHPLYYLLMHEWFVIFPRSEFWARAPSCIAVSFAAAGVVVLAKLLSTRNVAITAGIVFAILPRVTWAGIEARPYALTCVASVWLTIILIVAIRRQIASVWVLYCVISTLSMLLNIYLPLLIIVHLCVLVIVRPTRSVIGAWSASTGLAVGLLVPYFVFMRSQSTQLSWIEPLDFRTLAFVFGTQYFDRAIAFAFLAVLVVGLAAMRHLRQREFPSVDGMRRTITISIAWIVIPTGVILIYSASVQVIYADRYLSFTAPAMAMLLGVCIVAIARSPARIAAVLVLFVIGALPNFIAQRSDYGKVKMDYSQVADLIAAHAAPGDCLLLDDTVTWRPGPIRPLVAARPDSYRDLVDVGLGERATSAGTLWDANVAPHLVRDRIERCNIIWTISEKDSTLPAHEEGVALPPGPDFGDANAFWVPANLGFRLVERWQFNLSQVTRAIR